MQVPVSQTSPFPVGTDPVLTLDRSAEVAGVSPYTLRRAGNRREIKILRLSPRRIGIRLSELNRWLNERPQAMVSKSDADSYDAQAHRKNEARP